MKCVVSGVYDRIEVHKSKEFQAKIKTEVGATERRTKCAHIFPVSMNPSKLALVWSSQSYATTFVSFSVSTNIPPVYGKLSRCLGISKTTWSAALTDLEFTNSAIF